MYHGGSFADIDEDGKLEIAIGCYDGHVYVLNSEDGSLLWEYSAPYYIGAPTSIADLNRDNHLEIVYVSYNIVGALSYKGDLLWSYTTIGNAFRGVSIADINGDGCLDVVFGSEDGTLRILRGDNGQKIRSYDLQKHYGKTFEIDHAPVIADFNNDGKLDIFIVGGYGVYPPEENHGRAYALTGDEGTGPGWPMFRHDLHHSAYFETPPQQNPPFAPSIIGPTQGKAGEEYEYTFRSIDPNGDNIFYYISWGDGTDTGWIGPYTSGESITLSHTWSKGEYKISAKAKDIYGAESPWATLEVTMPFSLLKFLLKFY
jgi:hypothetical protein